MKVRLLSILIPAYNEASTIGDLLQKVHAFQPSNGILKEIVVVDDGSSDGTFDAVNDFIARYPEADIHAFSLTKNKGKGAALHLAIEKCKGDYFVIQDADLEYDPEEINLLLQPVIDADADVVYGSRFLSGNPRRVLLFWHSVGNRFLTGLSNMFTNLNLTDMETCYKLVRSDIGKTLTLKEKRFGFEPEITAKLSKVDRIRFYEVGISYYGRTFDEGKKITWKDGVRAIYCILRYNLFR